MQVDHTGPVRVSSEEGKFLVCCAGDNIGDHIALMVDPYNYFWDPILKIQGLGLGLALWLEKPDIINRGSPIFYDTGTSILGLQCYELAAPHKDENPK